jgi:hypothetical protein
MQEILTRHRTSTFGIGEIRAQLSQIVAEHIPHSTPSDASGALRGVIEDCDAAARAILDHKRCATLSDAVDEIHAANVAARNVGQKKV